MCHFLPSTPTNRRAKFDAASFILGGEILNRTNTHTHKIAKKTNKRTLTDISTPCLSACVDKNITQTWSILADIAFTLGIVQGFFGYVSYKHQRIWKKPGIEVRGEGSHLHKNIGNRLRIST